MTETSRRHRRFTIVFIAVLFVMCLSIAGITALVDCYGVVGTTTINGITDHKSARYETLSKPYLAEHLKPRTIVTGSSIPNVGIDPNSPFWSSFDQPVFNFGVNGASPTTQHLVLINAISYNAPRLVVILTSFEDDVPYLDWTTSTQQRAQDKEFSERLRLTEAELPNKSRPAAVLHDYVFSLLSVNALKDSVRTLFSPLTPEKDFLLSNGFEVRRSFDTNDGEHIARSEVDQKHRDMAPRLLMWMQRPNWPVGKLTQMIMAARSAGADVAVVIAPTYIEQEEMHRRLDLLPVIRDWRNKLVEVVDRLGRLEPARGSLVLWDFQALDTFTNEPLPPSGTNIQMMRWWWDTSHFRPELGAMIIKRIETQNGQNDFGARLDKTNADIQWNIGQNLLDRWEISNPERVEFIKSEVDRAQHYVCNKKPEVCVDLTHDLHSAASNKK